MVDFLADGPASPDQQSGSGRCVVIHPYAKRRQGRDPHARVEEAVGLAEAIELTVIHAEAIPLDKPRPATMLGKGTIARLAPLISGKPDKAPVFEPYEDDDLEDEEGEDDGDGEAGDDDDFVPYEAPPPADPEPVELVVIDAQLTPIQQRNLEKAWNCKVIDRTGLILEIFGRRARTKEGQMQVELAALTYARSRLVRSWTHLERQRGGLGFVGGPGETQIEMDRRLIGDRITRIKKELEEVKRTRNLHRQARKKQAQPVVALVGYTNAGKSTLFNKVTRADVMAKDQLFATLDPTMRNLDLPSGRSVILSDTVGFISNLPHELVAAFHATLEEVCEADVVIHVRDISHPHTEEQKQDVHRVLIDELDMEEAIEKGHFIEALNKIDLLPQADHDRVLNLAQRTDRVMVPISSVTGEGLDALLQAIDGRLGDQLTEIGIELPASDGATMAWIHAKGEVLEQTYDEATVRIRARLSQADISRLEQRLKGGAKRWL